MCAIWWAQHKLCCARADGCHLLCISRMTQKKTDDFPRRQNFGKLCTANDTHSFTQLRPRLRGSRSSRTSRWLPHHAGGYDWQPLLQKRGWGWRCVHAGGRGRQGRRRAPRERRRPSTAPTFLANELRRSACVRAFVLLRPRLCWPGVNKSAAQRGNGYRPAQRSCSAARNKAAANRPIRVSCGALCGWI